MSDDAYARIIKVLEPEQEVPNVIGVVTSIKPLKIKIGNLEIDKDNILINPSLLDRGLNKNDELFIYRNNQVFIVVCKVVSL